MLNTRILWVEPRWMPFAIELRRFLAHLSLREIDEIFESTGARLTEENLERERALSIADGTMCRPRAQVWMERIDWKNQPEEVLSTILNRTIRKFQSGPNMGFVALSQPLIYELGQIGFDVIEDYKIIPKRQVNTEVKIPESASGIRIEISRLEKLISTADQDPHPLIGGTKNLVEATCKFLITQRGGEYSKDATMDELIKKARVAVGVVEEKEIMQVHQRELLSGLGQIVRSISTSRNRTRSSGGHGSEILEPGLEPHFARLVVDCGLAWTRFMLEQLEVVKRSTEI
jgi:hypothetical protein